MIPTPSKYKNLPASTWLPYEAWAWSVNWRKKEVMRWASAFNMIHRISAIRLGIKMHDGMVKKYMQLEDELLLNGRLLTEEERALQE